MYITTANHELHLSLHLTAPPSHIHRKPPAIIWIVTFLTKQNILLLKFCILRQSQAVFRTLYRIINKWIIFVDMWQPRTRCVLYRRSTEKKAYNEKHLGTMNCGNAWIMILSSEMIYGHRTSAYSCQTNQIICYCDTTVHRISHVFSVQLKIMTIARPKNTNKNQIPNLISSGCFVCVWWPFEPTLSVKMGRDSQQNKIKRNKTLSNSEWIEINLSNCLIYHVCCMRRGAWYFDLFVCLFVRMWAVCMCECSFVLWSVGCGCFEILRLIAPHFRWTKHLRESISHAFLW